MTNPSADVSSPDSPPVPSGSPSLFNLLLGQPLMADPLIGAGLINAGAAVARQVCAR